MRISKWSSCVPHLVLTCFISTDPSVPPAPPLRCACLLKSQETYTPCFPPLCIPAITNPRNICVGSWGLSALIHNCQYLSISVIPSIRLSTEYRRSWKFLKVDKCKSPGLLVLAELSSQSQMYVWFPISSQFSYIVYCSITFIFWRLNCPGARSICTLCPIPFLGVWLAFLECKDVTCEHDF